MDQLNQQLCDAVLAKKLDMKKVETLLNAGADPLGPIPDELNQSVFEYLIEYGNDGAPIDLLTLKHAKPSMHQRLPMLTKCFIEHGMKVSDLIPSEDGDHHLEMWSLAFNTSRGACEMLQILLDNGLRADAFDDFLGHFVTDFDIGPSELDAKLKRGYSWGFRMIMLAASYPYILEESEYLREWIEADANDYDISRFRNYDDYRYTIDISTCRDVSICLGDATISVFEKSTNQKVWTMRM